AFTLNVHEALAASVAPARLTVPLPAVAVIVPPPHVPVSPLGVATTNPAGKVSVNATPFNAVALFGLVMVNDNVVLPFTAIDVGLNDLAIDGGPITISVAVVVLPVASVDVTVTLLFFTPAVVPVTFTLNVHVAPGCPVVPLKLTVLDPA